MKGWKKITGMLVLALVITAAVIGYNKYTAGPDDIKSARALAVTASGLLQEYSNTEVEANKKYIGKIIAVTGEIKELGKNQEGQTIVILNTGDPMNSINCTMEEQAVQLQPGTTVTLKGLCTGYMMDVYITRCYVVK
jgi:tRNA_anti-like